MKTRHDKVLAYYSSFNEWDRLSSPEGAIEFRRACELLTQHLPGQARILDLGGGPGRYSAELAQQGHRLVLADPVPALLDEAQKRFHDFEFRENIESIDNISAEDLSRYQDDSFDAVIAFGPYYHLISTHEREAATREIHRVVRKTGLVFVAMIPRISGVVGIIERAAASPDQVPPGVLQTVAETGVFHNATDVGFQEGYYPLPGEIENLFENCGFEIIETVSLKSITHRLGSEMSQLPGPIKSEAEQILAGMSRQPEVVATCGHAVMVGRKRNL